MTVIFSKKCELALQAVLFLSIQEKGSYLNARIISEELNLPKEFVSKVLQTLTGTGIIASRKGQTGGFALAKDPKKIRLIHIVQAIDGLDIFEKCVLGFPGCKPDNPCPLHHKWGALRDDAFRMLADQTLEELKEVSEIKISTIKTI